MHDGYFSWRLIGYRLLMTRGYPEDNQLHPPKSATDALALLQSMAPNGRVAPIPDGTILKSRYRIEQFLRGSDLRNLYVVSWHDPPGSRYCHECGNENNEEDETHCQECLSELGARRFMLSERWRTDFQPYFEVMEIGLFHTGLSRIYDVCEQGQRLFTVTEPSEPRDFLVAMGSPLSRG